MVDMTELESVRQLVANIASKNFVGAEAQFATMMPDRISAALDVRRQEIAADIYGSPKMEEPVDFEQDENE